MHETPALRECFVGKAEGMLRDDISKMHGEEIWERWISIHPEDRDFAFPGGESKSDHLKRLVQYVEEFCLNNSHYQRIAVSTHGGSLRRFVHHCEGAPQEPAPLPNCVLYKLSFEPTHRVWRFHKLIPATK
ncbi:phosphoglyceromutase [compost metagenome]